MERPAIDLEDVRMISCLRDKIERSSNDLDLTRAEELRAEIEELEQSLTMLIEAGHVNGGIRTQSYLAAIQRMQAFMDRKLSFGEPITRKTIHEGHRH